MSKIIFMFKAAGVLLGFLKEVERRGSERFSDENALRDRLRLESFLWQQAQGKDKGWRALTGLEDDFLRYCQLLMKSGKIAAARNGGAEGEAARIVLDHGTHPGI